MTNDDNQESDMKTTTVKNPNVVPMPSPVPPASTLSQAATMTMNAVNTLEEENRRLTERCASIERAYHELGLERDAIAKQRDFEVGLLRDQNEHLSNERDFYLRYATRVATTLEATHVNLGNAMDDAKKIAAEAIRQAEERQRTDAAVADVSAVARAVDLDDAAGKAPGFFDKGPRTADEVEDKH